MKDDRSTQIKKAKVYAETLFLEAYKLGGVKEALALRVDLSAILEASTYNANLFGALRNDSGDIKVVLECLEGASDSLYSTFTYMLEQKDMYLIPRVFDEYEKCLEKMLGVVIVDVSTVVSLDDKLRKLIEDKCSKELDAKVLLHEHIDPQLLGGIILSARGKMIDMSLLSIIKRTRSELIESGEK